MHFFLPKRPVAQRLVSRHAMEADLLEVWPESLEARCLQGSVVSRNPQVQNVVSANKNMNHFIQNCSANNADMKASLSKIHKVARIVCLSF